MSPLEQFHGWTRNPLAGERTKVYSGSATLGSAYPLNSGTIESLAAGFNAARVFHLAFFL